MVDTERDGRVTAIEIETDKDTYRIDGDRIRWVLRPKSGSGPILKSTLFKMSVKRSRSRVSSVNLVGGGNGHGVGMCQAGAISMSDAQRYTLARYWPIDTVAAPSVTQFTL